MFAGKNLRMTQKNFTRWFNKKKRPDAVCYEQMRARPLNTKSFIMAFISDYYTDIIINNY